MLQKTVHFSLLNAAVGSTLEDIEGFTANANSDSTAKLPVQGKGEYMTAEIANTGAVLTNFVLLGKTHTDGAWVTLVTGAGWATAGNLLDIASSGLNTLADAATALIRIKTGGFVAMKFQASCATTTSLTVKGTIA